MHLSIVSKKRTFFLFLSFIFLSNTSGSVYAWEFFTQIPPILIRPVIIGIAISSKLEPIYKYVISPVNNYIISPALTIGGIGFTICSFLSTLQAPLLIIQIGQSLEEVKLYKLEVKKEQQDVKRKQQTIRENDILLAKAEREEKEKELDYLIKNSSPEKQQEIKDELTKIAQKRLEALKNA